MEERILHLLKQAELAREKGDTSEGNRLYSEAMELAEVMGNQVYVAKGLDGRVVCNKHWWQKTGNEEFLLLMSDDITRGLNLDIEPECKAPFYLRSADILASLGEAVGAEAAYREAHGMAAKGGRTEGEYLSHWAESLVDMGQCRQAVLLSQKAIILVKNDKPDERWKYLITLSGLYGRLAKAAWKSRRPILLAGSAARSYWNALRLAYQFGMPMRLEQFHLRLRGKGV